MLAPRDAEEVEVGLGTPDGTGSAQTGEDVRSLKRYEAAESDVAVTQLLEHVDGVRV